MLDEKIEYKEYVTSWKKNITPRLLPKLFFQSKDSMYQGMERPLVIIARHFLFDEFHYENAVTQEEQTKILLDVTKILESWCGFLPDGEKSEYSFNEWFKNFHNYCETTIPEKAPKWQETKTKKSNDFKHSIFSSNKENTIKAVSYERAIARGVEEGPLCTYYLICQNDFANHVIHTTDKSEKILSNPSNTLTEYRDMTLKLIAAYLIERERTGNDYVSLNRIDVSHWRQKEITTKLLRSLFYNGELLFARENVGGNTSKIHIPSEFLSTYKFRIVKDKNIDLPDNCTLYEDRGSGKPFAIPKRSKK